MPDTKAKAMTPPPQERRRSQEPSDVSLKGLAAFLVAMLGGAVAIHLGVGLWLKSMSDRPAETASRPAGAQSPLTSEDFPRLQIAPAMDLQTYLSQQEQRLNSYGWINRTAGVARVPIRDAMHRIVQQGVPRWDSNPELSPLEWQHGRARKGDTR